MFWAGKELKTLGELFNGIASCETPMDAKRFMELYKAENPHAEENIGYLIGYASPDERKRLYGIFGDIHPVFKKC